MVHAGRKITNKEFMGLAELQDIICCPKKWQINGKCYEMEEEKFLKYSGFVWCGTWKVKVRPRIETLCCSIMLMSNEKRQTLKEISDLVMVLGLNGKLACQIRMRETAEGWRIRNQWEKSLWRKMVEGLEKGVRSCRRKRSPVVMKAKLDMNS